MHPAFSHHHYELKRQVLALTGKIRIYGPDGALNLYSEQKMFRLREDIRVYEDETKIHELLWIQARQVIDFAAAYDVIDSTMSQKIGVLRRKGWRSLTLDTWEILDAFDRPIGMLHEDSLGRALLRRLLLGTLLPQQYDLLLNDGSSAGTFRQHFNLFRYELALDFRAAVEGLDRRLGLAAAILLAIIEGKQKN
ncbi:MAG: hypothetical protein ACK2T2_13115 [Anaerolineales bacterium]|jgi:hypothetical protein